MPVYSHSRLVAYENCPRKYRLQYVDRITVRDTGVRLQERKERDEQRSAAAGGLGMPYRFRMY